MKAIIGLTTILVLVAAGTAVAQEPTDTDTDVTQEAKDVLERSGIAAALDSIAERSAPELEKALEQLAVALNSAVSALANDPELRRSAVEAAQGMVVVAQVVIVQQSEIIQEVLRTAADEIANLPLPSPSADEPR